MRLTLYDFLRIGHIKRWHNVNTGREQTVAEHCFMVMLIALHLYDKVIGSPKPGDLEHSRTLLMLLVGAMFHDAPEAAGGDTPTPAKRLIRELTGDPAIFDKMDEYLMPELPYIGGKVPAELEIFIRMADKIEAYHFIHDNGLGPHAEIVKMGARRGLEDLVLKMASDNWTHAVNEVLTAMGLPYVHPESRISPP